MLKEETTNALKNWDCSVPAPGFDKKCGSLVLTLAVIASYHTSINGDFVFDDTEAVLSNKDVTSNSSLFDVFHDDFWGAELDGNSHKSYRPLTVLFFRFINVCSGDLTPLPFHVISVGLHAIVSCLAYFSYQIIFYGRCPRASFLCALLFAVHPVHTECIAGIVGQAELLSALFALSSFIVYSTLCYDKNSLIFPLIIRTVLSCLLAVVAMLCKEQGIAIMGVSSIYDIVTNSNDVFEKLRILKNNRTCNTFGGKLKSVQKLFLYYRLLIIRHLILVTITGLALYFRWIIMGSELPAFKPVDNPASFEGNLLDKVLNYNYIYALNSWLLLCPEWLCFDWSMGCVPLISVKKFPRDSRIFAVIVFWLMTGLLFRSIFRHKEIEKRFLVLGFAWVLVLFLPASNIFFRVGFVIAERVLYLPSFGFILITVTGLQKLSSFDSIAKKVVRLFAVLLIVVFIMRSHRRSIDWKTEKSLFQSGLSVCPLNAKVHYNVAKNSADSGNVELALKHYREALRLHPEYDQAMNNLANLLKDSGELHEAKHLLDKAVKLRPEFAAGWMNLGIVLSGLKDYEKSEYSYLTALKYRTRYPDCYYNLGNLYLAQGKQDKAFEAWLNATSQKPTHSLAWSNMIVMLDSAGKYDIALNMSLRALSFLAGEPSVHFNLANVLGKLNRYEESEIHFRRAVELQPYYPLYHINLGVLYHRWEKFCLAKKEYEIALQLDPSSRSARSNLRIVTKLTGNDAC